MSVAHIQRIGQQLAVVRSGIQHDRQHPARVDSGRSRIYGKLSDRDIDPADAPVPDTENAFRVGRDDQVDVSRL